MEDTIDKEIALKKIDEIHRVMVGSNRLLFSGPQMLAIGALLLVVPVLYFFTDGLTFGLQAMKQNEQLLRIFRAVTFGALFFIVGKYGPWKSPSRSNLHPLVAKTFRFEKTLAIVVFATGITLTHTGHGILVPPLVLIFTGMMFNVMAAHAGSTVHLASWGFIGGGVAYLWLQHAYNLPQMWMLAVAWMGVMYIWMGISSLKASPAGVEHGA